MEINFADTDALRRAVTFVAKGLPARPAALELGGIVIHPHTTGEGYVTFASHDGDGDCRATVKATVTGEIAPILLPGKFTASIIAALPDKPMTLRVDANQAILTAGATRYTLSTISGGNHPLMGSADLPDLPDTIGTIDAEALAVAVNQVAVATGKDMGLPLLTGIHITLTADTITLAATDRYRLAVRTLDWKGAGITDPIKFIVPAGALSDASRGMTGDLQVRRSTGDFSVFALTGANRSVAVREFAGEFPKYESLLPKSCDNIITVSAAQLVEMLKRGALLAGKEAHVRLDFEAGALTGKCGSGDTAFEEHMNVDFDGPEFSVAFNPGLLADALNVFKDTDVTLGFTGQKPVLVTSDAVPGYKHIVMPVRLPS